MQLPRTAEFRALILYSHVVLEGNTHIFNDFYFYAASIEGDLLKIPLILHIK